MTGRRLGCWTSWLACGAALMSLPGVSWAVLGESVASVQADQIRLHGLRRVTAKASAAAAAGVQSHEIHRPDGMALTEYVRADGIVFALAWHGPLKPDLRPLLGTRYDDYAAAVDARRAAMPRLRLRAAALQHGDLIVRETGHFNSFVGRAWAPGLVPAGVDVDALR